MSNIFHDQYTDHNNHALTAKTYADIAERDADTAYLVTENINKKVRIETPNSYYMLFSISPVLWLPTAEVSPSIPVLANDVQIRWDDFAGSGVRGIKIDTDDNFATDAGEITVLPQLTGLEARVNIERSTALSAGETIGSYRALSRNSFDNSLAFGKIEFVNENSANNNEDGSIRFGVVKTSADTTFLSLNDGDDGVVRSWRDVVLSPLDPASTTPRIDLRRDAVLTAADPIGNVRALTQNSDNDLLLFGQLEFQMEDATAGSEEAALRIFVREAGTTTEYIGLNKNGSATIDLLTDVVITGGLTVSEGFGDLTADTLTIVNAGAGGDPILSANSIDSRLVITADVRVEGDFIVLAAGVGLQLFGGIQAEITTIGVDEDLHLTPNGVGNVVIDGHLKGTGDLIFDADGVVESMVDIELKPTDPASKTPHLIFNRDTQLSQDQPIGAIRFFTQTDLGASLRMGQIDFFVDDITSGAEKGGFKLETMRGGLLETIVAYNEGAAERLLLNANTSVTAGHTLRVHDQVIIGVPGAATPSTVGVSLDLRKTDEAFKVNSGTEAQRDSVPTPAFPMMYGNADTSQIDFYNGLTWQVFGGGDVSGPVSAVDGNVAIFDGATGKIIEDSGLSSTKPTFLDVIQVGGDASNLYDPTLVSTTALGSSPRNSTVVGNYLYVVDDVSATMLIFDVTDPTSPVEIGRQDSLGLARGVDVVGQYVFVSTLHGSNVLYIIDALDKANPVIVGSFAGVGSDNGRGVKVVGNVAFITNQLSAASLRAIDITDVTNPVLLGTFSHSDGGTRTEFDVVDGIAYISTTAIGDEFRLMDVTDPSNMTEIISLTIGKNYAVRVVGRYAYVLREADEDLAIFDISDPANTSATPIGTVDIGSGSSGRALDVRGDFVYMVDAFLDRMLVANVSDPTAPALISNPLSIGANPVSITTVGRYAYITDNNDDDLKVIDLSGIDVQNINAGNLDVGEINVRSNVSAAGRVSAGSLAAGVGGVYSSGPITSVSNPLSQTGLNTKDVFTAEQYIAACETADTHVFVKAPITLTDADEITFPNAGNIEITSSHRGVNTVTYTGTGTLYTTVAMTGSLTFRTINMLGNSSATLFALTGSNGSFTASATFLEVNFNGWGDLGVITSYESGIVFEHGGANNSGAGFEFHDTFFVGFHDLFFSNFSTMNDDFVEIGADVARISITNCGFAALTGETAILIDDFFTGEAIINNVFAVPTGQLFNPSGLDETHIHVRVDNASNNPDSTVKAELFLAGNTATTDIPAVDALVEINLDVDWISSDVERLTIASDGTVDSESLNEVTLKIDGNINLEPANATKDLSVRVVLVLPVFFTVTFTNGTDIINETATARVNGDLIAFKGSAGTLPAELRFDIVYYVVNQNTNDFQVSYTSGGSAITFTDDGSPTVGYRIAELHGSSPTNSISGGTPRDLIPQASIPSITDSTSFLVVSNNSDAVDIEVNSGYQRYFE